jgi:hypothetical protein
MENGDNSDKLTTNHGVSVATLKIANILTFIVTMIVNAIGASGKISGLTQADIATDNEVKLTPDGGICLCLVFVLARLCFVFIVFIFVLLL